MRLERLDLTRYGRFTGKSLTFDAPNPGEPDLHIVYGPNEAGKSTLFSAWLDLLFGIPMRSNYSFLHKGPTMQIGARLSYAGGSKEIRRVKRNKASLLDAHDAPLPETVLQSALNGLTREGYSAMFSLDDETLEKGGDSILASHGDLGEMLFSASAGLAELTPKLEEIRTELDGFHKTGKRSGWLSDTRKQLTELDNQRRQIEITSTALNKLVKEAEAAEVTWRNARKNEDEALERLDRLQRFAASWPLQNRLSQLLERQHKLSGLPEATTFVRQELERLQGDCQIIQARIADRALRLVGLKEKRDALCLDPTLLARADDIDMAETLRAEHDAALKDLPRRQQEAHEAALQISSLTSELGQAARPAADLILHGATILRLRAMLSERSGLRTAVTASVSELQKARDVLARERDVSADTNPAEDESTLSALLPRLQTQDPAEASHRARTRRNQSRDRLTTMIEALAPWQGDAEALHRLAVPSDWQLGQWKAEQEVLRQEESDIGRLLEDLDRQLEQLRAASEGTERLQAAIGLRMADAAAARQRREAMWAEHLSTLNNESARNFELSLREDDQITALLAETIAEAKRNAQGQTDRDRLTVQRQEAQTRHEVILTKQAERREEIKAVSRKCGLVDGALPELERWLERRQAALTERTLLREADTALSIAQTSLDEATGSLALAMGAPVATGNYETLFASAIARLQATERRQEARQRLKALTMEVQEREQAEQQAQKNLTIWQQAWREAAEGTILETCPDSDPGLGRVLDLLDQLGVAVREEAMLSDRVAKMTANRHRFVDRKTTLLQSLNLPETTSWTDVMSQLRRAQDADRDCERLTAECAAEEHQDSQDRQLLSARNVEMNALGASLGWVPGDISLVDHIDRCLEATELRAEIRSLRDELQDYPQPSGTEDPDVLRQQIVALKTDQQLLRHQTEALLEAHLNARRQIDAVGADDTLARIASERANLLQEVRDRTADHLARRLGMMAFDEGLRRYRDEHRSAMLSRASQAFRRLTNGAYTDLASQPDGLQEILVAHSAGEGAKQAVDLSKGTRFQLYLALRIAGYHELALNRPSVPFIADDIMETFDDARSAAAFDLLSDMSRVGQVIYLTHHRHLCDMARDVCPGARITHLQDR